MFYGKKMYNKQDDSKCLLSNYNYNGEPKQLPKTQQEAQLPQRDSASATHVFLGSLTDRALH